MIIGLLTAGCIQNGPKRPMPASQPSSRSGADRALTQAAHQRYLIRPGDVLGTGADALMASDIASAQTTTRVRSDGRCIAPFAGPIQAAGLTLSQLQSAVTRQSGYHGAVMLLQPGFDPLSYNQKLWMVTRQ